MTSEGLHIQDAIVEQENLMEHPLVLDFLEDREIREEDKGLIEQALTIPRQTYLEHHNTPSLKREDLGNYLEGEVAKLTETEPSETPDFDLKYAQVMLEVCRRYNWTTAWGLNTVMEKVAPTSGTKKGS